MCQSLVPTVAKSNSTLVLKSLVLGSYRMRREHTLDTIPFRFGPAFPQLLATFERPYGSDASFQ